MRSSIKFDFLAFFSLPLYIIIYMHTFSAMKKKLFEKLVKNFLKHLLMF